MIDDADSHLSEEDDGVGDEGEAVTVICMITTTISTIRTTNLT